MERTVFAGAAVFDGLLLHADAVVVVEDGRVAAIVPPDEAPAGARVRLGGGVLAPGFVDLQVNGGGGVMLNGQPDVAGIATISAAHGRLGTTGLLPTLITDTPDVTRAAVAAGVAAAEAAVPGFLGLHLEGPHLDSAAQGGARSDADPADGGGGPRPAVRGGAAAAGAPGDGGAGERDPGPDRGAGGGGRGGEPRAQRRHGGGGGGGVRGGRHAW